MLYQIRLLDIESFLLLLNLLVSAEDAVGSDVARVRVVGGGDAAGKDFGGCWAKLHR